MKTTIDESSISGAAKGESRDNDEEISVRPKPIDSMNFQAAHV